MGNFSLETWFLSIITFNGVLLSIVGILQKIFGLNYILGFYGQGHGFNDSNFQLSHTVAMRAHLNITICSYCVYFNVQKSNHRYFGFLFPLAIINLGVYLSNSRLSIVIVILLFALCIIHIQG